MADRLKLAPAPDPDTPISIAKPSGFDINKFKSKRAPAMANVETLLTALPVHKISGGQGLRQVAPGRGILV